MGTIRTTMKTPRNVHSRYPRLRRSFPVKRERFVDAYLALPRPYSDYVTILLAVHRHASGTLMKSNVHRHEFPTVGFRNVSNTKYDRMTTLMESELGQRDTVTFSMIQRLIYLTSSILLHFSFYRGAMRRIGTWSNYCAFKLRYFTVTDTAAECEINEQSFRRYDNDTLTPCHGCYRDATDEIAICDTVKW